MKIKRKINNQSFECEEEENKNLQLKFLSCQEQKKFVI